MKHWRTDIVAGLTTFLTMAYIVVVNPAILSTEGTGLPFSGVMTATVLLCFSMTLLMGLYANLPFAVGPGMGINAFFTYTILLSDRVPWPVALGMVFWAGVLFLLISLTPLRVRIAEAIPEPLRIGAAAGIGLFLLFIGLKQAGLVVADPVTLVRVGSIGPRTFLSLGGLFLAILLLMKKSPFAFLLPIAFVTAGIALGGGIGLPTTLVAPPDFSLLGKFDALGALRLALLPTTLSILFTDLFDSLATFVGVSRAAGLVDKRGEPLRLKEALVVDSFATFGAGIFGTSSGTAYIESAAGIEAGGRTGRTSVVTALCFIPCLFFAPLFALVPAEATAPILILVGLLMARSVAALTAVKLEEALPALISMALIPLTFSITQGMLWGFLSHTLLFWFAGRAKEIKPAMYFVSAISVFLLAVEYL